jgi:hypothetical protein
MIAFLVYAAGSWILGEVYPFSRFDMYASSAGRSEGAVPVFLVDGKDIDITDYDLFTGIDPDLRTLLPPDVPCSMEYIVRDAARWIAEHRAAPHQPDGPAKITIGYRILSIDDSAGASTLRERMRIVAEGRAWPR